MIRGAVAIGLWAALAACSDPPHDVCEGVTSAALTAADRKLVGQASAYPADGMLRERDAELVRSQRARREVAWAAVARAVEPVAFAIAPTVPDATLPRWHTWYGKDDLKRMFTRTFRGLTPDQMRARAPFTDVALDDAFAWNPHAVEELPTWPPQRFEDYRAAIDTPEKASGVAGIDRVQYSPGASRHLMRSYPAILGCLGQPAPPAIADAPTPGPRRMLRETVALATCGSARFGPYFVGAGETLTATVDGAELRVRAGAEPTVDAYDCFGASCTAAGPGPVWIELVGSRAGDAILTIDYQEADPAWAACLDGAFPLDAVIVKADWRRAELGITVPIFDTSAATLTALRASPEPTWTPIGEANPGPADIYSAQLPNGNRYRLSALHLMTKELDHWLWVTLWWSTTPDDDFGADRPAALATGPWRNYKMCAVVAFDERDPDPRGGATGTLGAALAAAHDAPSWCSNPFLENGANNATSSCVGCHQHGGTVITPENILGDGAQFPRTGRTQVRNNFPTDYSWAVMTGDELGRLFADEVQYWTPPDP